MTRAVLTAMLLLAVLIQAAIGCFARHSHERVARTDTQPAISPAHDHHRGHSHRHHHGGHDHGPPPAHFHFGGDGGEEHEHEESGSDTSTYVVSRAVSTSVFDVSSVGYIPFDVAKDIASSGEQSVWRKRTDASGRSGWPSGQRLSLLGVWLI